MTQLLRSDIVSAALTANLGPAVAEVVSNYLLWMSQPNPDVSNPFDPDVRQFAYCSAIANGLSDEWYFLYERFLDRDPEDKRERSDILAGLGCSQSLATLQEYLNLLLDPAGLGQVPLHWLQVLNAVSSNPVGRDIVFTWLSLNWERIMDAFALPPAALVSQFVERLL